jgi:multiple sugar transport system permease protein
MLEWEEEFFPLKFGKSAMTTANTLTLSVKKGISSMGRENLAGYLFILPWLIGFVMFVAGPMLFSFTISFFKWDMFKKMKFIGLQNYLKILTDDQYAVPGLLKTLVFVVIETPFQLIIALLLALLLNQKLKFRGLARALIYLPAVLSGAISGNMWKFMYDKDLGVFNYFLSFFDVKLPWLLQPKLAFGAVMLTGAWAAGTSMILFLAALQGIPDHYYEAAAIDGAGAWKKFFHITIPFITPTILYNLIIVMIAQFQCVVPFMVITGGGPAKATYVFALYEYETAFQWLRFGQAAALSWIILVVVLITTLLILASSKYWVFYEAEGKK